MYINTQTLQRTTESEIRSAFYNTSFPTPFVPPEGYAVLFETPQPTHDPITQMVREATPALTSKGNWEQQWAVIDLDAETITANQTAKAVRDYEAAKAARAAAVEAITVTTTSGKVFNGDERAQDRMSRSLNGMDETDTIPWILYDNSIAVVGRTELREALRLAGAAMSQIWVAPYLEN